MRDPDKVGSVYRTIWFNKLHGWRAIAIVQRERIARFLFGLAVKIGGQAERERSNEHFRDVPGSSQDEAAQVRQRELLDIVERAKDEGRFGHTPF